MGSVTSRGHPGTYQHLHSPKILGGGTTSPGSSARGEVRWRSAARAAGDKAPRRTQAARRAGATVRACLCQSRRSRFGQSRKGPLTHTHPPTEATVSGSLGRDPGPREQEGAYGTRCEWCRIAQCQKSCTTNKISFSSARISPYRLANSHSKNFSRSKLNYTLQ